MKQLNALHVFTVKYQGPKIRGSRVIIRSDRFRQSVSIPYDQSLRDSLENASIYLSSKGFELIGTGEGKEHMYLISTTLKPLKGE